MTSSTAHYDVVIVGASIAGVSTADGLRRDGFTGTIALVSAETHRPYDRPPLSKKMLQADWRPELAWLRPPQYFADAGIELLLGSPAAALDTDARVVTLASGGRLVGRDIVIATGGQPRTLPAVGPPAAHPLRSMDDALLLRERLTCGDQLVVVGGGFIGAELAASATTHGARVTVLEASRTPMAAAVGDLVGTALVNAHRRRGVRFEVGTSVAAVESRSGRPTVSLADGRRLPADAVVIGLGIRPATDWLVGSGLQLTDGVLCDAQGRTSAPHVFAAGDVAAWHDRRTGTPVRSEHWTSARDQATTVARTISGAAGAPRVGTVPYFWSDQFDLRLQAYGWPADRDDAELAWGSFDEERFVVTLLRRGRLVGVVGVNAARQLRRYYQELAAMSVQTA